MHTYWMDMYCMDTYWRDTCCTDTYWHDTYWIDTYWRDAYWRDTCWMDTYWHDTCWRDTYWRDTDWNDMCGSVEWCILILIDMHGMIYCPQSSEEPCDETSFGKKITSFEKMHAMKTHGGQEQFKSFNTSLIALIWISRTVFCSLLWAVPMKHELSCSSLVSWEKTQLAQECRGAQVKNSSYTCPWSKSNKNCSCQVSQGKTEHSKAQHIEALAAKTRLLSSVLDLLVTIWQRSTRAGHTSTNECQNYTTHEILSHDSAMIGLLISKTTSAWYKAGKNLVSTAMLPTSAKTPWANQLVTQYIV